MSRILWGILAIGAASYAIAAFALAPKARLNNLEGQALERATRHRERGDWDLAIAELEAAREAGAEGDILLASLGTAYLKMGEHDKATPLLAEGVAGLRQRKNPVGIAAVLVREASYALGVPKWRTITSIVLPTAMSGIITGVMLAVARVAGETAPLLLTTFLTQSLNWNLFSGPQAALPTFIWDQISSGTDPSVSRAWGGALVLILFVAVLYIGARIVARIFAPKTR